MQRVFLPATGLLIRPSNQHAAVVVASYADLRAAIGGPVEAIRLAADVACYVREDAASAGLPANQAAGRLARRLGGDSPAVKLVSGPAIVFGALNSAGEWDGHDYDCPAHVWQQMKLLEKESEVANVAVHHQGLLFSR